MKSVPPLVSDSTTNITEKMLNLSVNSTRAMFKTSGTEFWE